MLRRANAGSGGMDAPETSFPQSVTVGIPDSSAATSGREPPSVVVESHIRQRPVNPVGMPKPIGLGVVASELK